MSGLTMMLSDEEGNAALEEVLQTRTANHEIWLTAQNNYHKIFRLKKLTFWQDRINSQHGNPQQLWRLLSTICENEKNMTETSLKANDFAKFFMEKVEKIHASTATVPAPQPTTSRSFSELQSFTGISVNELCHLISDAPNSVS